LRIADLAEREGRAVVVAVNKWDLEPEKQAKLHALKEGFERLLPQLRGAPLVALSAKTGKGLDRLQEAIVSAWTVWNSRVSTGRLNQWLADAVAAHPPPAPGGKRVKLRYITQAKTRPPGFAIMASNPEAIPEDYKRYLMNSLRDTFHLPGTPLRLFMRASSGRENPFKATKNTGRSRLNKHSAGPGPRADRN
jgi:GTP-binding protein